MAAQRRDRDDEAAAASAADLRRRAEEQLKASREAALPQSRGEIAGLVHELHVHQIELEMQNEELREAQLELDAARSKYFALFDLAPVGYLTMSADGVIHDANLTAARLLGVDREALAGTLLTDFITEGSQDAYYFHRQRLSRTKEPQRRELLLRRRGADPFWAHIEETPPDAQGQEPPLHRVTITDIDESIKAREEIQRLTAGLRLRVITRTDELEAVNKELEAFAYAVSHDVRAPLRSIDGFAEMVLQDRSEQLSPDDVGHLQTVRAAAQRMARLLDDLLGLSQLGHHDMLRREVDVSTMATEIAEELRRAHAGRKVECLVQPGMRAVADPELLRVILSNLMNNAWKFTGKHDSALVEVGTQNALVGPAFYVRDDGAGFDPHYADQLFGVFQRLHSADEYEGEGIGLATVQRLVARHGGRVWAAGAVEQGATFFFTLPA